MSVFNKIMSAHAEAKTAVEHAAAAAEATRNKAEASFAMDFAKQVQEVAASVFQQFADDALKYGFPATVESANDGNANPIFAVRLIPVVDAQLGRNASEEITYTIKGLISEQKVEHASYYDQRPGKNGVKRSTFGIQSINQAILERELGEFLSSALKARASA